MSIEQRWPTRPGVREDGVHTMGERTLEVSVVMPCLNEADTLGTCVEKARRALRKPASRGEVIVADNGSTDGSQEIAANAGRPRRRRRGQRGYGNALMGGIAAARGHVTSSWATPTTATTFCEVPEVRRRSCAKGYDLVQGCRLPAGGGHGHARRHAVPAPLARATRCSRCWPGGGSERPSTTFIAACGIHRATSTAGSTCAARAWSSPPR